MSNVARFVAVELDGYINATAGTRGTSVSVYDRLLDRVIATRRTEDMRPWPHAMAIRALREWARVEVRQATHESGGWNELVRGEQRCK